MTPPPPPPPSGLEKVRELFTKFIDTPMARNISSGASKIAGGLNVLGRYVAPPLAVGSAAGEIVDIKNEINKPPEQRDPTRLGLSGGALAGTAAALAFPVTGAGLAASSALSQYLRDREMRQQQMTPEELYEDYYGRPYQQQPTLRFGQPDPYYKN
jgi:hypothetical protein